MSTVASLRTGRGRYRFFFILKRLFSPLPSATRRFDVCRVVFVRGGKTKRTNLDAFRSVGVGGKKSPKTMVPSTPPISPVDRSDKTEKPCRPRTQWTENRRETQ